MMIKISFILLMQCPLEIIFRHKLDLQGFQI